MSLPAPQAIGLRPRLLSSPLVLRSPPVPPSQVVPLSQVPLSQVVPPSQVVLSQVVPLSSTTELPRAAPLISPKTKRGLRSDERVRRSQRNCFRFVWFVCFAWVSGPRV